MFWKRKPSGAYEFLIVGLGNPGARYETTRHNAGFLCVTLLENELRIKVNKLKFHALVGGFLQSLFGDIYFIRFH